MKRVFVYFGLLFIMAVSNSALAVCSTGTALEFDGADDYVDCGNGSSLDVTELTWALWIKRAETTYTDERALVSNTGPEDIGGTYALQIDEGGEYQDKIQFIRHGDSVAQVPRSQTLIDDMNWHHIAVTRTNNGDVIIYIDGLQDATGTIAERTAYSKTLIATGNTSYSNFNGIIDEVAIHSRALTAEEIEQMYRCGTVPELGLVAYWDFDEGVGQEASDSSGNGNHGYLGFIPSAPDFQDPNWVLSDILRVPDYYVDDDALTDPGPGDPCVSHPHEDGSIDYPFDSIQEALNQAVADGNDCHVILVKEGWYEGPGNYDIDTLGLDVTIKSENGPWRTIIDCHYQGRGFTIDSNEGSCTVIDGFFVLEGEATPINIMGESLRVGGGILCNSTSPTIKDCIIAAGYAADSGGGIYLCDSNSTISRCEILVNDCEVAGAGIFAAFSRPTIRNTVVAGNYGYYCGGVSSNAYSDSNIINCTIADNFSDPYFGVRNIECYGGRATVTDSILWTRTLTGFWAWFQWWYGEHKFEPNPFEEHIAVEAHYDPHDDFNIPASLEIHYSNVEFGMPGIYQRDTNGVLEWGYGNLNTQPMFSNYWFLDYHLMSGNGRWTPIYQSNGDYNDDGIINFGDFAIFATFWQDRWPPSYIDLDDDGVVDFNDLGLFCSRWLMPGENEPGWEIDDVNSPCIDAGDPCSPYLFEPLPNGGRVNMGAYGNTEQASKSPPGGAIQRRHPDMDGDKDVDFVDFAKFAEWWLLDTPPMAADFDYSYKVDGYDLMEFCRWWLWGTP